MNNVLDSIKETWGKLTRPMQIGAGVFVLGVFISLVLFAVFSTTEYQVLFSNLDPEDAGTVVSALKEQGIPYRIEDNGTAVLIPKDDVLETRISLATSGIPTGGVVGFEIFNATRLGETEADRQLRYQWALQGELTRTIRQMDEIADARIHIVMPKRSLFVQDSPVSTASVLVQLKPGAQLSSGQVRAISNLISTSVEGLTPENVTIVDTRGNVLNAPSLSTLSGQVFTQRFEMERAYEKQLEDRIVAMLERIYGYGNIVARVSATLDFDQYEEYSETYAPVTRDGGLIRSQQNYTENYRGTTSQVGGIPGVDSNIPGYVQTDQGGTSEYESSENTINYELNRTETWLTGSPGQVKNLSVSVWVNGNLAPAQLSAVEESVSRAIGLRPDRGDGIYVDSVPFETSPLISDVLMTDAVETERFPYWIVAVVVLLIVGAVLLTVIRKHRQEIEAPPVAAGLDLVVDDEQLELELSPEDKERLGVRQSVQTMAKQKPEEVAQLMKTWLVDD
jgi:flagellar M-ring protein FliF